MPGRSSFFLRDRASKRLLVLRIFAVSPCVFNAFRDLTASGFWTSKMGITDLQYIGNTVVAEWKGCPDEVLKKLGVERG